MASAAKSISVAPIGVEPAAAPVPGSAEMFAAMVAGVGAGDSSGDGVGPEVATEDLGEKAEAQIDASILLPMLDQQRAAVPAAKLVGPPVDASSPATAKIAAPGETQADPIPVAEVIGEKPKVTDTAGRGGIRPTLIDGKGQTVAPIEPANGPIADATPVMRPIASAKPEQAPATDPAPVMRPLNEGKAAPVTDKVPVMRPIDGGKPATGAVSDPAPVMRPIDGAGPKGKNVQPAVLTVKGGTPAATDTSQPEVQHLAPKSDAPPAVKSVATKAAGPEVQIVAAEAQAAPVAAKARIGRVSTAPMAVETAKEAPGATPVPATATETRAAVQPLHAAPALVQPLAAPVGAPVQNVAAALSQQVLDMSGGDAWIDQIARDISQTAGKDGTMRFRLAPETLGELKVEITHSERGAHVRLNVSSEAAQHALAAAEHKLTAEARAQGVRIAETEINFTGGQSQSRDASAFAREQGQQQAQASHQPRTPRGTSANDFTSSAAAPEGRGRTDRYA